VIAAAVLTRLAGGILFDRQEGELTAASDAIAKQTEEKIDHG